MPVDVDRLLSRCYACELLSEEEVKFLCERAKLELMKESNVPKIAAPCSVVGDIHGQFYDLLELFRVGGRPPETNYLFLGDYVDRGLYSVQTIALLVCLKVRFPNRVFLLRGNHETRQVTRVYGFYAECMRKYGNSNVWQYFTDLFDYLNVAALIEDSVFCVHGGLSPSIHTVDQITTLHRFQEVPHEGALSDFVWSDPDNGRLGFNPSNRGAGYSFGADIVERFLSINNLRHVLRAHQLCMEGYQVLFDDQLSTVWSAPNYCYRCGNLACVLEIESDLTFHFNLFTAAPQSERGPPAGTENLAARGNGGVSQQPKAPEYFL